MKTATSAYLQRRCALLLVRAMFDAMAPEAVEPMLEAELAAMAGNGPSVTQASRLVTDLLSEGSYLLVSLRYLIESGGAAWPADAAERTLTLDSLAALGALQEKLIEVAQDGGDPLPVFLAADRIYWLTEGENAPPAEGSHFRRRDEIVARVLSEAAARTRT